MRRPAEFHFAVHSDYLLGGRVDEDEGFSPLAEKSEKFVMADQCPLQDECGAIRMKGMGAYGAVRLLCSCRLDFE